MSEITNAIKQICDEKGLSYEAVVETIESALAAAYRKDFGEKNQNIKVEFDPETGKSKVYDVKTVVEDLPEEPSVVSADASTDAKAVADKKAMEGKEGEDGTPVGSPRPDFGELSRTELGTKAVQAGEGKKGKGKKIKKQEEKKEKKVGSESESIAIETLEEKRRFNPKTELQFKDARLIKKTSKVGDEIKTKLEIPSSFGRMAAQTAKQVIIQKLREAERDMIFNDFKNKEHEVIAGVVQRREGRTVLIDLDRTVGILPAEEQIQSERYRPGERIKVYVKQVNLTPKGPEIILSRTTEEILRKVFYLEIPEISNGLVEIKAVAREAGSRSKVAVAATSGNVDPIGSCVGQRGARIQTIIAELGGEKIDIIEHDEDSARFIANALAPAKVINVDINERDKKALVKVKEDQLSLAIGRDGQNVRLAARLTGWRLDIVGDKEKKVEIKKEEESSDASTDAKAVADKKAVADEKASTDAEALADKSGDNEDKESKEKDEGEEVKPSVQEVIQDQGEKAEVDASTSSAQGVEDDIPAEMPKEEEKKEEGESGK